MNDLPGDPRTRGAGQRKIERNDVAQPQRAVENETQASPADVGKLGIYDFARFDFALFGIRRLQQDNFY